MRWSAWDWVKFTALMLSVGVWMLPFSLELPAPLALALVTVALVAAASIVIRHAHALQCPVWAPAAMPHSASARVTGRPFILPEAPGTRGTVRSRAPAL